MNDDWRLQVDVDHPHSLLDSLDVRELEHDLSDAFHDRVVVSRDDTRVFLYAGSREQAEAARKLIAELDQEHAWNATIELKRWHPEADEWEDPDKPLPASAAGKLTEHEELIAAERKRVEETGEPEYEVRVDLPSRREAERFCDQLEAEGLPAIHRWRFLLIGATDEDTAKVLAERLRGEAPEGSTVKVEGTWKTIVGEGPRNPFAVLGGLGE
ncbi:MAG TPA: hypothetical protein VG816_00490 [Solirubrobacterales bacterium]|nr:hypothetical protein [Solirubrobacterales bacterium]